ncbi:MAG: response regulator [Bacteroidota bacterium]|nr:response regulator [Bacteroidota bacterium]
MIKTVIIDDEPDAITSLEMICNEYCNNVKIVGTALIIDEAYKIIRKENPDLLLLDIDMPRGNAFDLMHRFPKRTFEVILISAFFKKFKKQISQHNIFACIEKPVDIDELHAMVELIIEKREKNKLDNN